jgi:hypothetical protein
MGGGVGYMCHWWVAWVVAGLGCLGGGQLVFGGRWRWGGHRGRRAGAVAVAGG